MLKRSAHDGATCGRRVTRLDLSNSNTLVDIHADHPRHKIPGLAAYDWPRRPGVLTCKNSMVTLLQKITATVHLCCRAQSATELSMSTSRCANCSALQGHCLSMVSAVSRYPLSLKRFHLFS